MLGVDEDPVQVEDDGLDHASNETVALSEVDGGRGAAAALGGEDLADEERVVARAVFGVQAALEPAERIVDQRRALRALAGGDAVPVSERGHAPCEVLGDRLLVSRQEAERESAASRRSSCMAACRLIATPTSGGSSESETRALTVRPRRSPRRRPSGPRLP